LVNHFATSNDRVTNNTSNKKQGLDLFYRKYLHQFSKELQDKSLTRAKKLFNYTLPDEPSKPTHNLVKKEAKNKVVKPFNLIIGAISDNANNLTALFKSFLELHQKYGEYLKDYKFLILENTNNEYEIRPVIDYFVSKKKLNIEIISNPLNDGSIAENRTFLQQKVYQEGVCLFEKKCVSWIIDDDHLFKFDAQNKTIIPNYFQIIAEQSNSDIDAMFGQISDAPPLPFLSTLRTQLIDFYYNLTYFANCNPAEKFELNKLQVVNIERAEFYYDLSNKNYQHLEYPYYLPLEGRTNAKAFKDFLKETARLSNGVNVFRKLTFKPETVGNITNKTSIYRGGNTLIFNSELLLTPNYTPKKVYNRNRKNRRSDFNWAIINKNIFKRKLCEIILPLKHDRKLQKTSLVINEDKLQADIEGLIFYRFFENILSQTDWESKIKYKNELRFYKQIKKQMFTKIKINNYRVQHLIYLILEILKNKKLWWFENEYRAKINYHIQQNIFALETLRFESGKRKFQALLMDLENNMKINDKFINKVINDIKTIKTSAKLN
jgi:hypothetical protein